MNKRYILLILCLYVILGIVANCTYAYYNRQEAPGYVLAGYRSESPAYQALHIYAILAYPTGYYLDKYTFGSSYFGTLIVTPLLQTILLTCIICCIAFVAKIFRQKT